MGQWILESYGGASEKKFVGEEVRQVPPNKKEMNKFWTDMDMQLGDLVKPYEPYTGDGTLCTEPLSSCVDCMECWPDRD